MYRIIALSAALALASCGAPADQTEQAKAHDFTTAPEAVAEALAEQVGVPFSVMVEPANEVGWVCGSVTTPGFGESRFFVWDGHQLAVQPRASDDMTPAEGMDLAAFMIAREGCKP